MSKTSLNQNNISKQLLAYQENVHLENQKKIKIGIRLLLIIPIVFLLLLFITNSNKIIFLVLWIISLFVISCYLILVEYRDHTLQKVMNEIRGVESEETESLINTDDLALSQLIELRANAHHKTEEKS